MKFILGTKIGMSQVFDEKGKVIPVTLVKAGPCTVTQVKAEDKDKYQAVQIGFGKRKKMNKPQRGHLKDLDSFRYLREFRLETSPELKRGDKITVESFAEGDKVSVVGMSKGKGFQGVVKRHNFSGGPASHGHRHVLRRPGSIGAGYPQHVRKGMKMAGRMGRDQVTIKQTPIVKIDKEANVLAIKGPVPGTNKGLVAISTIE